MAIYITGDTHGEIDHQKLNRFNFPESNNLTKNDYVIIAGDAGILWSSYSNTCLNHISNRDRKLIDWYNKKNFTTLFVDGNHENHNALNYFPEKIWNGGKVHYISNSIIHLMRGQIYTINGKTFFVMGGADSVDKMCRIENTSWWKNEMPSREEYEEAISNLEKVDFKVDYVITHTCGSSCINDLITYHIEKDTLTKFFDHLEFDLNLKFKHWYFGHHHLDKQIDDRHTCVYDKILRIEE